MTATETSPGRRVPDPLAELRSAADRIASAVAQVLPDAYLHDGEHLPWLALVSRSMGRSPTGGRDRLGVPIFIDPAVPPDVLELRWPSGQTLRIGLP